MKTSEKYEYSLNWFSDRVLVDTSHRKNGNLSFTRKDLEDMIKLLDEKGKR